MGTHMTNVLKCVRYSVSYLETFCEKKIREKLTGEKLQGGVAATPPLSRLRVNIMLAEHFSCLVKILWRMFLFPVCRSQTFFV